MSLLVLGLILIALGILFKHKQKQRKMDPDSLYKLTPLPTGTDGRQVVSDRYFPPRPQKPVAAVPMPACRLYYPRYHDLSVEQRGFFIYWRQEYERGNVLPAYATYRFLYAYEVAYESKDAVVLEQHWLKLLQAYPDEGPFRRNMTHWAIDLRLQQGCMRFADLSDGLFDAQLALDLAIETKTPPNPRILLRLYSKAALVPQAMRFLREDAGIIDRIDTSPIIDAASSGKPTAIQRELFSNIGAVREKLSLFGPLSIALHSYVRSVAVRRAVDATVDAMLEIVGESIHPRGEQTADPEVVMVSSESKRETKREAIIRHVVQSLPPASSLEGTIFTIQSILNNEGLLLLLLVLWLSDAKPYVEGRIVFSSELRRSFEALGSRLDMKMTIGDMRKAYWALSHGPRAMWALDPNPSQPADIKTNVTGARFSKPLQHIFVGSAARTQGIRAIVAQMSKRLRVTEDQMFTILEQTTETRPSMRISA